MSMYNMLFGVSRFASIVFAILKHPPNEYFSRPRDGWVEKLSDGSLRLAVYTRNGGGNRDHYGDTEEGINCNCTGCVMTYKIPKDPLYLFDKDDSFDSTYATIYFKVPDDYKDTIKNKYIPPNEISSSHFQILEEFELSFIAVDPIDTGKKWIDAIELMKTDNAIDAELVSEEKYINENRQLKS